MHHSKSLSKRSQKPASAVDHTAVSLAAGNLMLVLEQAAKVIFLMWILGLLLLRAASFVIGGSTTRRRRRRRW